MNPLNEEVVKTRAQKIRENLGEARRCTSRLHQRTHEVPRPGWQDLHRGTASPHQQPVLLDFNRQATSQSDRISLSDAIWADDNLFNRQEVPLPRTNEAQAVVAVLRLLGNKAGHVVSGGLGRCAGSSLLTTATSQAYSRWRE